MAFAVDACSYPASEVVHWPLGYTMLISSRITRRRDGAAGRRQLAHRMISCAFVHVAV
jgi:hypothetical protein